MTADRTEQEDREAASRWMSATTPIWHVAFAVNELERGMADLSEVFGINWRPIREFDLTLADESGEQVAVRFRGTFSREAGPAIEIFQARPGTPLAQRGDNPFHHVGYWTEDRPGDSDRVRRLGWTCIASAEPPAHSVGLNIFRGPDGIAAELCDMRDDRPAMRDLFPASSPFFGAPDFGWVR